MRYPAKTRRLRARRYRANPDHLSGGLSEGHTEDEFDPKQLDMGEEVELEHTRDHKVARQIAMDHLVELPDYYTWLRAMELLAEQERGPFRRSRKARKNNDDLEDDPTEEVDLTAERVKRVIYLQTEYFDILSKLARSLVGPAMRKRLQHYSAGPLKKEIDQRAYDVVSQWTNDHAIADSLAFTVPNKKGTRSIYLDFGKIVKRPQGLGLTDAMMNRLLASVKKSVPEVIREEVEGRQPKVRLTEAGEYRTGSEGVRRGIAETTAGMREFEDVYLRGHQVSAGSGRLMSETDRELEEQIVHGALEGLNPVHRQIVSLHTSLAELPTEWQAIGSFQTLRKMEDGHIVEVSIPRRNLRIYHAPEEKAECPTCRDISKKLTLAPYGGAEFVRRVVDAFIAELRPKLLQLKLPRTANPNSRFARRVGRNKPI